MTPKSRIALIKALRIAAVPSLLLNAGLAIAETSPVSNVIAAVFLALVMCFQTFAIRLLERRDRPRPDYAAIARMEQEVWGEAFEHEGAPEIGRPVRMVAGQTQICKRCMTPYVRASGLCGACYGARRKNRA